MRSGHVPHPGHAPSGSASSVLQPASEATLYGTERVPRSKVACGKSRDKLIERANPIVHAVRGRYAVMKEAASARRR